MIVEELVIQSRGAEMSLVHVYWSQGTSQLHENVDCWEVFACPQDVRVTTKDAQGRPLPRPIVEGGLYRGAR